MKIFLIMGLCALAFGCSQVNPTPQKGPDWKPPVRSGQLEIRPLPHPTEIEKDYEQWVSNTSSIVRVYEATLVGSSNQFEYTRTVTGGDYPARRSYQTTVSFFYDYKTNGHYFLTWELPGKHDPKFLKADDIPRKIYLEPCGWERPNSRVRSRLGIYPKLQIIAVENIKSWGYLIGLTNETNPFRIPPGQ